MAAINTHLNAIEVEAKVSKSHLMGSQLSGCTAVVLLPLLEYFILNQSMLHVYFQCDYHICVYVFKHI